ncbi:hypothetical protein PR048_008521 [Dryococelus australis]|uniref:Tesmin/TSO1-like CXC domain-containing protein n=1 Tax=Dryococelus australis TaxID=614101 RepID=A0ABQ9HXP2_9NEOP|nr:hypothetical protein PR048_008521 [Dryococelus australis]
MKEWGWIWQNKTLEPTTTLLPLAPEELLSSIFCNCKKGCGASCTCRKVGLQRSSVCGQCNGQTCLNASSYPNDLDEESEYVSEVLEALEPNINDNENDDVELEIQFR